MKFPDSLMKSFKFAGLRAVINETIPNSPQLISLDVLCRECKDPVYEPVDPEKFYRIVRQLWINPSVQGAFEMKLLKKGSKKDIDLLEDYLTKHKPYTGKIEGRITIIR